MWRGRNRWLPGLIAIAVLVGWSFLSGRGSRSVEPSGAAVTDLASAQPAMATSSDGSPDASSDGPAAPDTAQPAAPVPQPATSADPEHQRPLGFRATAEQRMADLLAYLSADNLLSLRDALQQRALRGDADAAHRLRDIYDECTGVHWNMQNYANQGAFAAAWPGVDVDPADPRRLAALAIGQQRCRGIIPSGDSRAVTIELGRAHRAMTTWARDLGYPGMLPPDLSDWLLPERRHAWARAAALALLADGKPESLLQIADSIAGDATRYSAEAWTLVACDLGYPCAVPDAFVRSWCVQYGAACDGRGRLGFIREMATPRRWRLAEAQRDEILEHLRNGRIEEMMRPVDDDNGGGG